MQDKADKLLAMTRGIRCRYGQGMLGRIDASFSISKVCVRLIM